MLDVTIMVVSKVTGDQSSPGVLYFELCLKINLVNSHW